MCSSYHGASCTNVEETMTDEITDIGNNDDRQDEEMPFEKMMLMPMQDDSHHVDKEEEEHATQIHTKKRKMLIQKTFECSIKIILK